MNKHIANRRQDGLGRAVLAVFGLLAVIQTAEAAPFAYQYNDLCLGFRKNAPYTENYEVVVNIGSASNYLNAAIGTTLPVSNLSASQIAGSFTTLNNLSWSVSGYYNGGYDATSYPASVKYTLWVTVPRANNAVRSQDPYRFEWALQRNVRGKIDSILSNAAYVSQNGTSNQFNTASFVRETISGFRNNLMSVWMAGIVESTKGTLNDTWPSDQPNNGNIEKTTPSSFTSPVRSDLYEVRPLTDAQLNPIEDPHTGTSGLAYYVGYFELQANGTMTFTREAASTPSVPPPAPRLSIARNGNVSSISFLSTNQATYTLYFTNTAGLTTPTTNWPSSPNTITGDGSIKTFQDTTTDSSRIYRVGAH